MSEHEDDGIWHDEGSFLHCPAARAEGWITPSCSSCAPIEAGKEGNQRPPRASFQ